MIGETVYVGSEPVANVLVHPGAHEDGDDLRFPAGTVVSYTLAFPYDYPGPLHDTKVTVRGVECEVIGFCDHERPQDVFDGMWDLSTCPWDMTVPVRVCGGDMTAGIAVYSVSVTYDDMGDPVKSRTLAFIGDAQARMESGSESTAPDGSKIAVEKWWFVVPWSSCFAQLRPQTTEIDMGSFTYDVVSVKNVDMKSEFASFEAVLRENTVSQESGDSGEQPGQTLAV